MAAAQLDLFATAPTFPAGFRYQPELISSEMEQALLVALHDLPFKEFEFHGHVGNRSTVSFGRSYDFEREQISAAPEMPEFLSALRETVATFASTPVPAWEQVLVTKYPANAGIGWHRDKAVFGQVVGISLLSACRFRLRREVAGKWERISLDAAPRSAYLLSGPARTEWEHSIPPVPALRYSITYRTLAARDRPRHAAG
jgi:alkylated DNA repair dioxygenase AlkB